MSHEAVHDSHDSLYFKIFWWLLALTIIEVAVIFMPLARVLIAILLVGLALSKAALVAMYFMHLKFERTTLGLIAVTPLVLCVLLAFALLPDHTATPHQTAGGVEASLPPPPPQAAKPHTNKAHNVLGSTRPESRFIWSSRFEVEVTSPRGV